MSESPNGQRPRLDPTKVCGPRPIPVTYAFDIIKGAYPGQDEPTLYTQLRLLSWNGEHVSYWDEASWDGFIKGGRQMLRMMGQARTGLATPDQSGRTSSGLILPPAGPPGQDGDGSTT